MERYAPTIKDLAPRDIVARSMANEVREGRCAGPNKDYVLHDLTHLEPAHIDAKLPDITEFARPTSASSPTPSPCRSNPTAHYAMGGIPTNVDAESCATTPTSSAVSTRPERSPACPCTVPTVWAPTRLLDINVFGKRAGRTAAAYAKTATFRDLPEDAADS